MKKQLFLRLVVALGFPLIMTLVPVCEAAQPENPDGFVAPAVFQAAGPTASSIQCTIDAFRAALGEPNNANNPSQPTGRREINWDPDVPGTFPPGQEPDEVSQIRLTTTRPVTPFNVFLNTRGAQFTTPGEGLSQGPPASGPQGGLAVLFNNPDYNRIFRTFSPWRLFTPVGSNITEALFFIPGTNGVTPATVRGFGAVFTDVDQPDGSGNRGASTLITYFGVDNKVLFSSFVPASPGDGSLSFFGIVFGDARITRVRITTGDVAPGPDDDGKNDIVVMDDFIYAEPVESTTAGSGSISREVWTGIGGNTVANIPVGTAPDITDTLPSFEAPTNWADDYGTRVRGYITAPVTGSYTFWIAGDDNSELWLSLNDNPANKVRIGWVSEWTGSRQWDNFSSQKSAAITLTAGQRYYVEALQKEAGFGDDLAVGWARPGESTSAPSEVIPGSVLSPFNETAGPEINVLGNGTTIIDGDTTPSGSDHTDFGSTDFPNGTVTRTFTIQNLGTASLTVNPVTLSGANAADFSVIVQPASAVAAGGNTSFQVRFNPSALGTRTATLSVGNNDANENPYDFALQGTGATPGSGSISRDVWTGIGGNSVSNIPVGTAPNLTDTLPSFEAPTNWADDYGTRVRGYITAPATGSYTFWIAGDDNSELWLSLNDNPANKVRIGWVSEWTGSRQWDKFSSQKSAAITLTAGQRYYVEALQKEADFGDNLAVGWAKPGESTSAPSEVIPGSVLSLFSEGSQ